MMGLFTYKVPEPGADGIVRCQCGHGLNEHSPFTYECAVKGCRCQKPLHMIVVRRRPWWVAVRRSLTFTAADRAAFFGAVGALVGFVLAHLFSAAC